MDPATILAAIGGISQLITLIGNIKKNAQATAAWTDEESAAVDAAWNEQIKSHAWLTDEEGGK